MSAQTRQQKKASTGPDATALCRRLTRWFRRHARALPWREVRTGYTALVAELMLQQTQVDRVAERFPIFLARFPDVATLSRADEQEVLTAWQGLGYYRRARHLHAAARQVMIEHGGRIPESAAQLQRLPGIGKYTAGAIASIVHGERVPIVDGNVARVLDRVFARVHGSPGGAQPWHWEQAARLVEAARDPGSFNEGMMELGATVCTPRRPRCENCPIAALCRAKAANLQNTIPAPRAGSPRKAEHHHVLILRRSDLVYFEQRAAKGLWSNMWQLPTVESDEALDAGQLADRFALRLEAIEMIDTFPHQTTHRRLTFHVFRARTRRRRGLTDNGRPGEWRSPDDASDLPLSVPQQRVLAAAQAWIAGK